MFRARHLTLHANQIKPLLAGVHARSWQKEERTRELPPKDEVEDEFTGKAFPGEAETSD